MFQTTKIQKISSNEEFVHLLFNFHICATASITCTNKFIYINRINIKFDVDIYETIRFLIETLEHHYPYYPFILFQPFDTFNKNYNFKIFNVFGNEANSECKLVQFELASTFTNIFDDDLHKLQKIDSNDMNYLKTLVCKRTHCEYCTRHKNEHFCYFKQIIFNAHRDILILNHVETVYNSYMFIDTYKVYVVIHKNVAKTNSLKNIQK